MTVAPLYLCVSQDMNSVPYQFKITNTKVFSLEEALFHVFHNWKQTVDDFCCPDFVTWVNNSLGLSYYASKIQELSARDSFADRLMSFLELLGYFSSEELSELRAQLTEWENRMEWERLKERGDYSLDTGEPSKAIILYKRALTYGRNPELLNNAAVALIQMEMYAEAMTCLKEAIDLADTSYPPDSLLVRLILNRVEAAIYAHDFEVAQELITEAGNSADEHEILYLRGELYSESGSPHRAAECFEEAVALSSERFYVFRLTDLYCKMRKYDQALETLNRIENPDKEYYMKQAEVQALSTNVPGAVKSIERALITNINSIELWIALAMYHRMDYDVNKAQSAITKALSIDPKNDRARLENARIKKALGKTKDYQVALHNILKDFKGKYRELYEAP